MRNSDEFLKKYHRAIVLANKDNLEKMKPRIASLWVKEWIKRLDRKIIDGAEFAAALEEFLSGDLGFADNVGVSLKGDRLLMNVEGCGICPGNEMLRQAGETGMCPILPTGLTAISRVFGMKATLEGVDKEEKPIGFCTIEYSLAEK